MEKYVDGYLCQAVIEVLEIIYLSLENVLERGKGVQIKIKLVSVEEQKCQNDQWCWFLINLQCLKMDSFPENMNHCLKRFCPKLQDLLKKLNEQFVGPFLSFCSQDVDENTTLVSDVFLESKSHELQIVTHTERKTIKHSSVQFKVYQQLDTMARDIQLLQSHLKKIKTLHSMMNIQLVVKIKEVHIQEDFCSNGCFLSFGSKKLVTDPNFYHKTTDQPNNEDISHNSSVRKKILPKSGFNCTLKGAVKIGVEKKDLFCSCIAFLIPPPPTPQCSAIRIDCTKIEIAFYGPSLLPLAVSGGGLRGLSPDLVFTGQDYGLVFANPLSENELCKGSIAQSLISISNKEMEFDWVYQLHTIEGYQCKSKSASAGNSSDIINSNTEENNSSKTLYLIFVIDVPSTMKETAEKLETLKAIRQNFGTIVCKHRQKFRKASKTAVNKLLCNLSARDEKEDIFVKGIPVMVKSICDVVKHSTDNLFRERTFGALKSRDVHGLSRTLTDQLWMIAGETVGVDRPQKTIPDKCNATETSTNVPNRTEDEDSNDFLTISENVDQHSQEMAGCERESKENTNPNSGKRRRIEENCTPSKEKLQATVTSSATEHKHGANSERTNLPEHANASNINLDPYDERCIEKDLWPNQQVLMPLTQEETSRFFEEIEFE